ncbi:MFS transporter [Enterococcus sp. 669A]|uniref:MFS-type drug efflux transporter P55 n=1 Tax=Candidatus Enterococcus moelleringii TaxID=2815325 RepID=A0ABS3LE67_9ENTE|nr:MFS transporter [Enterococcus sp. 669A]MBO1307915.1 MFS transporter [Enterococcus sp. 669A]
MKENRKGWLIFAIYLATFMTAIESTIVVTAVHAISVSLNSTQATSLIFSVYLFSSAVATPVFGRFADRYGKKRIFQLGLLLFLVGTTLCGAAPSVEVLIAARIIQGIGAGGIMPMTFALIGELFDLETRGKVMGLNNSAWGIASLVAPLLGGFLLEQLSWHWIFLINVPIAIVVLIILQLFYHEHNIIEGKVRFAELRQQGFLVLGLILLLLGIQYTANSALVGAGILIAGLVYLLIFYRNQKKQGNPVIPVETLGIGGFRLLISCIFLINGALIGFQVYLPLWVQTELAMSSTKAGLALLPSSVFFIIGSYYSGKLANIFGKGRMLVGVVALSIVGFVLLGILPGTTSYMILLVLSSLLGFTIGTSVTISVITAQAYATNQNLSTVSGFITLCRTLGQSFMITFLGTIYQGVYRSTGVTLVGYHYVYFTVSVIFVLLIMIVIANRRQLE